MSSVATLRSSSRPLTATALAVGTIAVAVGLSGCSGSTGGNSANKSAAPSASSSAPASASPSAAGSGSPSAAASGGAAPGAAGALPAVVGAADLAHEPTIQAGSGTAPTSLLTKDLIVGNGPEATGASTVTVQYVGANYVDGRDFDASWTDGGQPAQFSLAGGVIQGFSQGIAGMKVGGRREIVIPPALGYGDQAQGPIQANETLVFVVDLKAVS